MTVTRYSTPPRRIRGSRIFSVPLVKDPNGGWVKFSRYQTLQDRHQQLLDRLAEEVERLRTTGYPPFRSIADGIDCILREHGGGD